MLWADMNNDLIQFICVMLNIASYLSLAAGAPRFGFFLMLCSQPFWLWLGIRTGLPVFIILAVFYTLASIFGIIRENNRLQYHYSDAVEAALWYFKIGWEPCDNFGTYWNKRLKKTRSL